MEQIGAPAGARRAAPASGRRKAPGTHRTTQHEGLESREQGRTGGGNATMIPKLQSRKTHFFFHRP